MAACQIDIEGEDNDQSDYYDILLLGRTGQGKSTTANKLLQTDVTFLDPNLYTQQWEENVSEEIQADGGEPEQATGGGEGESKVIFKTGKGIESVTGKCKLVSNGATNIRVLDTPGFADTRDTRVHGVYRGNFRIFRSILRAQDENDLAFSRVLYFLPQRGVPERAEGTLQEEIKCIRGFFGDEVFKIMVIIATNRYKSGKKEIEIDDEDIDDIRKVFMAALEKITNPADMEEKIIDRCPPVIYLSFFESDVISKIVGAEVLYETPLCKPAVVDVSPRSRPIEELIQEAKRRNKGRKLQFHDRCIKCSAKIIYSESPDGKIPDRVIINEGGEHEKTLRYHESKCHPVFLPRHSTTVKIVGGIFHIATLGVFLAAGKIRRRKFWPGFTNDEELCAHCKKEPSAEPCLEVGEIFRIQTSDAIEKVKTDHSTTLSKLHVHTQ